MPVMLWMLALSAVVLEPRTIVSGQPGLMLGMPSRDGRYLSFIDQGELAVRDLSTGTERRLTRRGAGEFAYFSAFSPDSREIAYAWFNADKFYELRVMTLDSQKPPRVVFRNEEAGFLQPCAWTPDGKQIVTLLFRRDNISQIALIPSDGGAPRVLKSLNWVYPKRMDVSPDGRSIVYDSLLPSGQRALYLLAADGAHEERLLPEPGDQQFPLFSPGGGRVLFLAGEDLRSIDLVSRRVTTVRTGLGRALLLGLTAAGDLYYGVRDAASDIFLADPKDVAATAVRMPSRYGGLNFRPAFSPDGTRLTYLSRRGTENFHQDTRALVVRDLQSGAERELPLPLAHIESAVWMANSKALAVAGSDDKGRGGLFLVNGETGATEDRMDEPDAHFRGFEAASGDALCVIGNGRVWCGARDVGPGKHIAVRGGQAAIADAAAVRIVTLDGMLVRRIAFAGATELAWSATLLLAGRGTEVWDLSGEPQPLPMPGNRLPGLSLSPDGKHLALAAGRNTSAVMLLAGAGEDRITVPLGLDALIPAPAANPLSPEKATLGKRLFFDKRLSRDGTIACASCHDPAHAFADLRPRALGVGGQQADRRSPRIANRAWGRSFFWDGRAATLEEQVLQPIANPKEMALDPQAAADRAGVTLPVMRDALATYVRTILAGDSPYDRYVAGDREALSPVEREGLRLFRGKGRCASCHVGPNLTDELLHDTGIERGKFKTPSLRDVARTPPFMHDGRMATLRDVIRHYDRGAGEVPALGLTEAEQAALAAFLQSLNGTIRDGY